MARTEPSSLDRALIEKVRSLGVVVTPYQLERWRAKGLIPRHGRRGPCADPRATSWLTPYEAELVAEVARRMRQGRRFGL